MSILIALVRLVHIFSGVFWAGGAIVLAAFVEPSVAATVPEGNKFMQRFVNSGFVAAMGIAGPLTVLAGLALYLIDSGGLQTGWITTHTGLGFTVGGIAGLIAFFIGFFISRTAAEAMGALGREMQAAGRPPTPDQVQKMKALQERLSQASVATAIVLAVAVAAMAMSRYL
ncbi:MAG: hypothetical protein M1482_15105 [Chloroflexi bacterium]|nr:hypothetical protein [Chloroflexota bacterium]